MMSAYFTNALPELDEIKTVTNNCQEDELQQIHKLNKVLITTSIKQQTPVSPIKITVGMYKVYTDGKKGVLKIDSTRHPIDSRNRDFGTKHKE